MAKEFSCGDKNLLRLFDRLLWRILWRPGEVILDADYEFDSQKQPDGVSRAIMDEPDQR